MKKIKLRINKFEIEVYEEKNDFFCLKYGDYDSLNIYFNEIEDLKEIIKRFEEKLENGKRR